MFRSTMCNLIDIRFKRALFQADFQMQVLGDTPTSIPKHGSWICMEEMYSLYGMILTMVRSNKRP